MPKKKQEEAVEEVKATEEVGETSTEEVPAEEAKTVEATKAEYYLDGKERKIITNKRLYVGKNDKLIGFVYVSLEDGTERLVSPGELAASSISAPLV